MRAMGKGASAILAVCAGVLLATTVARAGDIVPKVPIDKSKGECVLPGDQMRREHMKILKHRRDETMYRGIRGGKASFSACLTCHMVKDEKTGKPVTVASPKHFCRVCHDYAAVKVDCWSCHKSVPEEAGNQAMLKGGAGLNSTKFAQLMEYVQGGRK
jgi:hypothetical protein